MDDVIRADLESQASARLSDKDGAIHLFLDCGDGIARGPLGGERDGQEEENRKAVKYTHIGPGRTLIDCFPFGKDRRAVRSLV